MKLTILILGAFGTLSFLAFTLLYIACAWIAKGSPDVNGDPERDATAEPDLAHPHGSVRGRVGDCPDCMGDFHAEVVCTACGAHIAGARPIPGAAPPYRLPDTCPACQARPCPSLPVRVSPSSTTVSTPAHAHAYHH